jgi:hypothetical protein
VNSDGRRLGPNQPHDFKRGDCLPHGIGRRASPLECFAALAIALGDHQRGFGLLQRLQQCLAVQLASRTRERARSTPALRAPPSYKATSNTTAKLALTMLSTPPPRPADVSAIMSGSCRSGDKADSATPRLAAATVNERSTARKSGCSHNRSIGRGPGC